MSKHNGLERNLNRVMLTSESKEELHAGWIGFGKFWVLKITQTHKKLSMTCRALMENAKG